MRELGTEGVEVITHVSLGVFDVLGGVGCRFHKIVESFFEFGRLLDVLRFQLLDGFVNLFCGSVVIVHGLRGDRRDNWLGVVLAVIAAIAAIASGWTFVLQLLLVGVVGRWSSSCR